MPLFKVSVESSVPVSAVVVSSAVTEKEALEEVRFLQSRARVNWMRGSAKLGAIEAPYEIWAHPRPEGGFTVSLFAYIPISALQTVIAEDGETVSQLLLNRQSSGLVPWTYRGIPVGEYKEPIPTSWFNQQPDVVTSVALQLSSSSLYPGQSVVMSVDVTGPETPVGNVEFRDLTSGGAGTVVQTTLEPNAVTPGISRAQAVVVLPAGAYSIAGFYLGSDGFGASESAPTALTVAKVSTSVVITAPTPPIYAGQSVSLSVAVTQSVPGAPLPTGTLTLFEGAAVIGSVQLNASVSPASGSFSLGALPPATYAFTVQYAGDDIHDGSSGSVSGIEVQQVPTTTTVEVLQAASDVPINDFEDPALWPVFSQPVRFRAIVVSGFLGTVPTGTIQFREGVTVLATVTLTPLTSNSSKAEVILDNRPVGSRSVNALYSGNASFVSSLSVSLPFTVVKANTTVGLVSLNSPTKFGQAAQFDATVGVVAPATKSPFQQYGVAGSVTYSEPGPLVTVVNFDSGGHAVRSSSGFPVGVAQVTASYLTTAEYNPSANSVGHTVEKSATSMTMFFNQEPVAWFITFQIYATVVATAPGAGAPTGTVNYSVNDPHYWGNLFLGSAAVDPGSGVAQLSTTFFSIVTDTYIFTCSYTGSANFDASVVTRPLVSFGYFG